MENIDISYLHVFSYSQRNNTVAASLKNQVTKEQKEYRSKVLHELSNKKRTEFYNKHKNTIRSVLIEESKYGKTQGFTDNYIKVNLEEEIPIKNTIVPVLLKENKGTYMEGEIIKNY